MGFLRRVKVPDELPDLAIEDGSVVPTSAQPTPATTPANSQVHSKSLIKTPATITPTPTNQPLPGKTVQKTEVAGEDYLEFADKEATTPESILQMAEEDKDREGFFSKVLTDLNDEMGDIGKLGDWYNQQFEGQDVVSSMKDYWEGNKTDMIIRSFGSEYKKKISTKIKQLQELEGEWREIYFTLVKKEEQMKREEKELKETVSEFVELCNKRKRLDNEENEATKKETTQETE